MEIIERLERRDESAIELLKALYGDCCYGIPDTFYLIVKKAQERTSPGSFRAGSLL